MNMEEGLAQNAIAPAFYEFASGSVDESGFYSLLSETIENY